MFEVVFVISGGIALLAVLILAFWPTIHLWLSRPRLSDGAWFDQSGYVIPLPSRELEIRLRC